MEGDRIWSKEQERMDGGMPNETELTQEKLSASAAGVAVAVAVAVMERTHELTTADC